MVHHGEVTAVECRADRKPRAAAQPLHWQEQTSQTHFASTFHFLKSLGGQCHPPSLRAAAIEGPLKGCLSCTWGHRGSSEVIREGWGFNHSHPLKCHLGLPSSLECMFLARPATSDQFTVFLLNSTTTNRKR